jgi:5-methylcytosine-specific restriction endonuclease McrA
MKESTRLKRTRCCKQCGKSYILNQKYSKKQIENSKFCSRECQYIGKIVFKRKRLKEIELKCCVCNKLFKSYSCHRQFKTIHCSSKCAGVTNKVRMTGIPKPDGLGKKIVEIRRKNNSYIFSEEHRKKLSNSQRKVDRSGSKNPYWKGGRDQSQSIRKTIAYAEWRKIVFKRDNYTCKICGVRGVKIHADHIKRFRDYPELRLEPDNGRTLCVPCHRKTDTWGSKK